MRWGVDWSGEVRYIVTGEVRFGMVRCGTVDCGRSGRVRCGGVGYGKLWQVG